MDVKHRTANSLVAQLSSVSDHTRSEALRQLRFISKHDPESRPLIALAGAIPFLSETLYSSSHDDQDNAAATLLNLSISSREPLMSSRPLFDAFSHLLHNHSSPSTSPTAVQSAAATLHSLLVVDSYRPVIGAKRDIVYSLIDILRCPSSPPRSIKDALKALFGISLYPPNRPSMIHLGAVGPLFRLILNGRVGIIEDVTAVVAQIAGCGESVDAFCSVSGVSVLVDLLDESTGSSMRIKENAVSALLNLSTSGGDRVVEDIRVAGLGVVDGIADVAEHGTAKGKSKAASLLDLIVSNALGRRTGGTNRNIFRDSGRRFEYMIQQSS